MVDPKLPGLNYGTPLGITDLAHLESVYTEEFVQRTLATIGSFRAAGASFGIVSEIDPIQAASSLNPLFVQQNAVDGMTVDVYSGMAFADNGMMILLNERVEALEMINQEVGQQNVVFVEYVLIDDAGTVVKTRYDKGEAKQIKRAPDTDENPLNPRTLQVASIQDFQNSVLFPPDRLKNLVPIAFITIASKTDSPFKEVQVDLTRNNLTTNRPWFSPVDIEHRSEVGTGSSAVPHSLGLNDLSQGDLTLYEQLLNVGMVIGRDQDVPGVPGGLCFETVTPARVKIDDGSVTGILSQRYVELVRYPVRLLGAYSLSDSEDEVLVDIIPHTNILIIDQDEFVPPGGFRLQYSTVEAGEPLPNSLINDEIHFRQPISSRELVIAGGNGFNEIGPKFTDSFNNSRAKISLGTAGGIPKLHHIMIDADGQLLFSPQHVLCATALDDIGVGSVFSFENQILGAAKIRVGLQNVDLNAATVVRLRITGVDNEGATVTEDLTFDYSNYDLPVVGDCEENPKNFQITGIVWESVASLTVLERTADGPSTAVCVYADLDPTQTDAIRDACPVADAFWDGASICRIHDVRPVFSRLEHPSRTTVIKAVGQSLLAQFSALGSTNAMELLSEDLRDPHKFRLTDPIRFNKFADGLRSSILPEQPGIESTGQLTDQDIYTSQALRLVDGMSRQIHLALLGIDAQRYQLNGADGIEPRVEYRWSTKTAPHIWTAWTTVSALAAANGANFRIDVSDDDAFMIQLRVKGSVAGVVAIQYEQLGASQLFSGRRQLLNISMSAANTSIIALPFGQDFGTDNYSIVAAMTYLPTETMAADGGFRIRKIERFDDHAKIHVETTVAGGISNIDVEVQWHVNLLYHYATSDEGFGDTFV